MAGFLPTQREGVLDVVTPEEFVILADHGPMKLQSAVARAMILPPEERDHASILRNGEPRMLNFALIKHLRCDGSRAHTD